MYTRSFFTEDTKPVVPENYDGNAFYKSYESENKTEEASAPFTPLQFEEKEDSEAMKRGSSGLSSLIEKLPLKNLSSFLPFRKDGEERKFNFGTEEILICAAALYMFFSKSGDKECAIMLFILLFIN